MGSGANAIFQRDPGTWSGNGQQPAPRPNGRRAKQRYFQISGGSFKRQPGVGVLVNVPTNMLVRRGPGVRASGTAGLGAGAERLVDDGFDGARATAAFGAAAEAAIDLLGISGKVFC